MRFDTRPQVRASLPPAVWLHTRRDMQWRLAAAWVGCACCSVAQVRVFSVKAAVDGTTFDRKGRPRVQGGRRRRSSSASAASGTDSAEEHKGATGEGDSDASPRSVAPEAAPQGVPEPETPDIDQAGGASFSDGSGSHVTAVRGACVESCLECLRRDACHSHDDNLSYLDCGRCVSCRLL